MKGIKVVNKKLLALCLAIMTLLIISPVVGQINLTGTWSSDDNGTYYIRQIGNNVYGDGRYQASSSGSIKVNGSISANGAEVAMRLFNVTTNKSMGELTLKVVNEYTLNVIDRISPSTIGGSVWTKNGGFDDHSSGGSFNATP